MHNLLKKKKALKKICLCHSNLLKQNVVSWFELKFEMDLNNSDIVLNFPNFCEPVYFVRPDVTWNVNTNIIIQ